MLIFLITAQLHIAAYADMNANASMQSPTGQLNVITGNMPTNGTSVISTPGPINDTTITSNLQARLSESADLTGSNIMATADNGQVTLTGSVATRAQKDIAVKMAKTTPGVTSVQTDITVTGPIQ